MPWDAHTLGSAIVSAFFAILFLQSGLDKVFDRKGNLDWMTPHFANSPFRNAVPVSLTALTVVEMASGATSAASVLALLLGWGADWLPKLATLVVCVNLLMLFAGQRLAKDYVGAAALVPYFGVGLAGFLLAHWNDFVR